MAGVLGGFDLDTPVRCHENFPNGAKFLMIVIHADRYGVDKYAVVEPLDRNRR